MGLRGRGDKLLQYSDSPETRGCAVSEKPTAEDDIPATPDPAGSLSADLPVPLEPAPPASTDAVREAELIPAADTYRHYMRQIAKYPRLTREEETELATRYRRYGDPEAAYRLITGNLRLVVRIAAEYRRAFLNMLDLVQEGNIGLMQAVKKFDPFRGVPFSAYAAWWIRAYLLRHLLDHWSIVRVGTTNERRRLFYNLKREKEKLEQEGITPGTKLLAERLDASEADVIDVSRALSGRDVSLDAPVREDSDRSIWETIPVAEEGVDEKIAQQEMREILREKLAAFSKGLKPRERYTLLNRLVAEEPVTLQQIGDHFGITREAARLIEKKVIGRLRDYLRRELKDLRLFQVADDARHRPASPVALERRAGRKKKAARAAAAARSRKKP